MKKFKRQISIIMVLLLLTTFAGCGNNKNQNTLSNSENSITKTQSNNSTQIDAFDGIQYEVSGISPYCYITINNQGCSKEAQTYVEYTLDKSYYGNGEKAIITAAISNNFSKQYTLSSSTSEYLVSDQPEYVQDLNNVDMSSLKSELSDFITAEKGKILGTQHVFGYLSPFGVENIDLIQAENATYLSTLKPIKYSDNNYVDFYNRLSTVYTVSFSNDNDKGSIYVCINANNIVKYPDGSIKWGTASIDDFDFSCDFSEKSTEDCVTTCIMCNNSDYNISKVELN